MKLLLPDTWHFHRRNFLPLFLHLRAAGIATQVDRSRRRWWKRHGDYRSFAGRLERHVAPLRNLVPATLLQHRHREIPVFDCCRAELLCLLLPRPRWAEGGGGNGSDDVLSRAHADAEDRQDLLLCMAAACDWIEHWYRILQDNPALTHVLAYSGSYIYTRTLQEVASRLGRRLFCLETIFTGNEFYFEERATPIANRSLLGDPAWYDRLALPAAADARARLLAEGQRRLAAMRNKNVPASDAVLLQPVPRGRPGVLILGQVLNDFSLIETPASEASALAIYRRLLGGILKHTDLPVIFKAHPWERRRPNLRRPVTLQAIGDWLATLPETQRRRVRLLEAEPVGVVFPHVDQVVGICSQGLLEACQAGLKPAVIGPAFFGGKGFTHDFATPEDYVDALARDRLPSQLALEDYRRFEEFLARALVLHCVENAPAGVIKIAERLAEPNAMPQAEAVLARLPAETPRWPGPWTTLLGELMRNPRPWLYMLRRRRQD